MPLRSPKMYSFIFGFQRRTWWPKCTPASSNSFIVTDTKLNLLCVNWFKCTRRGLLDSLERATNPSLDNGIVRISNFGYRISDFFSAKRAPSDFKFEFRNPQFEILLTALKTGSACVRPSDHTSCAL